MIYLRDFSDSCRSDFEREIRKYRPDLALLLDDPENEQDIIVARELNPSDFEVV